MQPFDGLGSALRLIRIRKEMRQKEVAALASVTPSMLSSYETGKRKPELSTLERILVALEVELRELVDMIEEVQAARLRDRPPEEMALKDMLTSLLELGVINAEVLADLAREEKPE